MTDMDKIRDFYQGIGVILTPPVIYKDTYTIQIKANDHAKLTGYSGHWTEFIFDTNGKFLEQKFGTI